MTGDRLSATAEILDYFALFFSVIRGYRKAASRQFFSANQTACIVAVKSARK